MGNILLGKIGTASSYVPPYEPAKALNGNASDPTSRWLCNTVPGWLQVDLGKNYLVNRWVVRHMGSITGWNIYPNGGYNMSTYKLQVKLTADGPWVDIDTVNNNINAVTDRTFAEQSVRFVRLYVTKGININPQLASCMELEVYENPSADLTDIKVTGGTLDPTFLSGVVSYTVNLGFDKDSFAIQPVTKDPNATVTMTIDGTSVPLNSSISIDPGTSKTVSITVNAGGGTVQKVYTVMVMRASSPYLKSLATKPAMVGTFAKTTYTGYSVTITSSTTAITVKYSLEDVAAKVTINGVQSTSTSYSVPVTSTLNAITITVESSYGKDTRTYTINVVNS
ncbi:MAG TPA: cadherin-like beta sandwich domain-containing protein [Lachnospiraceae bacterium]|nr:cadherin-like beta sandwich domain-containing protein [Lachnospiraceae bacterium]